MTTLTRHYDYREKRPSTPCGPADYVKPIARGVAEVGTASHGGMRVSRALAQKRFDARVLALAIEGKRHFWFEEDCAYALVVLTMPELFNEHQIFFAKNAVKNYYPDEYTIITGEEVLLQESYVLQKRQFEAQTRDRFVVYSAVGDWAQGVSKGMIRAWARRATDGEKREFLIPEKMIQSSKTFGYVVDENDPHILSLKGAGR
jgi:hypothetical protein